MTASASVVPGLRAYLAVAFVVTAATQMILFSLAWCAHRLVAPA